MKDFTRQNPQFSLCGLNCALCPMHISGACPGCGGGAGNQSCSLARCSREHDSVEYCFLCPDYPCSRLESIDAFDSFIPHSRMKTDMEKARRLGLDPYQAELDEKRRILDELLANYNDGRKKSLFCLAVYLLDLPDLRAVMAELTAAIAESTPLGEKAALAAARIHAAADRRQIELKLRKKPKKPEKSPPADLSHG